MKLVLGLSVLAALNVKSSASDTYADEFGIIFIQSSSQFIQFDHNNSILTIKTSRWLRLESPRK